MVQVQPEQETTRRHTCKSSPDLPREGLGEQRRLAWHWICRSSIKVFQVISEGSHFFEELGIKSLKEWISFSRSGRLPPDMPSNPNSKYLNEGWAGWGDWLGTGTIAPSLRKFRPFAEARAFARSLGITGSAEWYKLKKGGRLPPDLPSIPTGTTAPRVGRGGATGWGPGEWVLV